MRMKMENSRRRRRRCRRQGLNFLGQRRRLHPAPGRSFPERPGEPRAPGASPVPGGTLRGAPTPPASVSCRRCRARERRRRRRSRHHAGELRVPDPAG